ncbi:alkylhydroperoxidase [Ectocarpus siliculosus]|uniref:Alkylhydroperoxidase n=1 Tax=Ectocarpus siliculosus TaxID=2880 RepID=D7FVW0_ECTSI|nr:alkylhydroperoxidase [Ectocarpus siliculosus]|eukprot:CBJ25480.1 alkylhydroperoxidase [Ectocarpus siliculosus]
MPEASTAAAMDQKVIVLRKETSERDRILDRWADAEALQLTDEEAKLNEYQRRNLKLLFGETGFNPPVPARNPISVAMHNPRFSAALWAVNTEAYRRKGLLSRSQKEVIALGVSLSNGCPHCAYIHTAMGPAAGDDVEFGSLRLFYQTRDADAAFPVEEGQGPMSNNALASWSIRHRDGKEQAAPCTREHLPEVVGTAMLFDILNRVVDTFVSKTEAGPMFPLPMRMMMKVQPAAPLLQRAMSWMMSWMMHGEDGKVEAGKVLKEINETLEINEACEDSRSSIVMSLLWLWCGTWLSWAFVTLDATGFEGIDKVTPIIKGFQGCADETPMALPEQLSWAAGGDETIAAAFAFLAAEAELLARTFVPPAVKSFTESWVSSWDGGAAQIGGLEEWLGPAVTASGLGEEDKGGVVMLRLMLVTIVASHRTDDTLLSECQAIHGFRGTHAAVLWSAFLAGQRSCQLAIASCPAVE